MDHGFSHLLAAQAVVWWCIIATAFPSLIEQLAKALGVFRAKTSYRPRSSASRQHVARNKVAAHIRDVAGDTNAAGDSNAVEDKGTLQNQQTLLVYKTLYHQLHNLEQHRSILPQAHNLLTALLSEGLAVGLEDETKRSILHLKNFDAEALALFIRNKDDSLTLRWEAYVARRRAGGPRELFENREAASYWLKQRAPSKFVDGAWLGHVHKVSTPFSLRSITKNAWQVLSEELGDGDLNKNHVHVYRTLMEGLGAGLPEAGSIDFIDPRHGLDDVMIWKAALAQLVISLFPDDFLPEILGFNMHFELLTWDTLRAIKELKELRIDDYYFLLHVSIDNGDSGHTAMAMQIVIDYMQHVAKNDGPAAVEQAWKRVQAGFIMSESFDWPSASTINMSKPRPYRQTGYEEDMTRIFKAKVAVSQKLHCASRIKFGNKTLVDWLDPVAFESPEWQMDFLAAFSTAKPWIVRGNSKASKFMDLIAWKGKMFGSFTQAEVIVVERWINALTESKSDALYWDFVGRNKRLLTPVHERQDTIPLTDLVRSPSSNLSLELDLGSPLNLDKFLPLWFAHTCLLECSVSVPFQTCNKSTSALILVLRAQYGFAAEQEGIAGMDEMRRDDLVDLVEVGLDMMRRAGLGAPASLAEVLDSRDSVMAHAMLDLSMRPVENADRLLGMALAFVELHKAMASAHAHNLLSQSTSEALDGIAKREHMGLNICLEGIEADSVRYKRVCDGFSIAKSAIEGCFGSESVT